MLKKLDLGIGIREQVVDQILAVKPIIGTDSVLVIHQGRLDGLGGGNAVDRRGLDCPEHVADPCFPLVVVAHVLEVLVIVGLAAHDGSAEVKHGRGQQPLLDQIQHVDDAPGTPVFIVKGMDALELMMNQCHLDQRIGVEQGLIVDEAFQIGHQLWHGLGRGRGVYRPSRVALENGAGHFPKASPVLLQRGVDIEDVVGGQQLTLSDGVKADAQGTVVACHFLGGRAGGRILQRFTEQLVMGGDDIFDFGTVLGLLQAQGTEQDVLVGHGGRHALELGKRAVGSHQLLEDGRGVEAGRVEVLQRGQDRQHVQKPGFSVAIRGDVYTF